MPTTLEAERPKAEYTCSVAELYAGLDKIWNSQAPREADFIAENTRYTAGLSVTRKAAIEAARILPDGAGRYADSRILHIDLGKKWEAGMGKWNSLERYIKSAFEPEYFSTRIAEAGKGYYTKAGDKDWESVGEMLKQGKIFITTHNTVLLADGGMPPTFAAAYNTAKTEYDTFYQDFLQAREDAQEQTDAKILANNAIWRDGREMMDDGQHIFRKNASVKERFTWESILKMLTPGSGSSSQVWETEAPMAVLKTFDTSGLNFGPDTMVKVEVAGNTVQLSSSPTAGPSTGAPLWNVTAGEVIKEIGEFADLTGLSETNVFVTAISFGPGTANLKVTFMNLE